MRSLEQLDSWISAKLKGWTSKVSGGAPTPELLEVRRDVLRDVRDHIQPKGEGRSTFPYNSVSILLNAPFADEEALEPDIRELLAQAGCPIPSDFELQVAVSEEASEPFRISYKNVKKDAPKVSARPPATVTVLRGQTDTPECSITADRFSMGRLKEVIGANDGLRRRNDLAFGEEETTVSREHAQIRYDAESGRFRLYDSISQRGTCVFRGGRRLDVSKSATRGLQLQSGDEIHLGDARVLFQTE